MLAFTVCSGKVKKTQTNPAWKCPLTVTSAFGVNLTLSKVQLEEHLPVFLGLGEAGSGLSKSQESCKLSQEAAVQLCSGSTAWSQAALVSAGSLCSVPWEQGAQPRLLEPGTGGQLPTLARAKLPELLSADVGMWD